MVEKDRSLKTFHFKDTFLVCPQFLGFDQWLLEISPANQRP